jgi:hypothetical protein
LKTVGTNAAGTRARDAAPAAVSFSSFSDGNTIKDELTRRRLPE